MKVFVDANIIVAVLNKEYPAYPDAARVLSLVDDRRYHVFTSPVCLAIAFYFAEKKHGTTAAKYKISILGRHLDIAGCGKREIVASADNRMINDFEDGIEYYSAVNAGCSCIITNDLNDFYFSEIEILQPGDFLKKYMLGKKR